MRSALITSHGDLSNLKLVERPVPRSAPGQALVRIHYSALNHLDIFVLQGLPGMKLPLPMVPGSDFSGEIIELNRETETDLHPGDFVAIYPGTSCGRCPACRDGKEHYCRHFGIFGETQDGGHCEYISVPIKNCVRLGSAAMMKSAAAGGLTGLTAHEMLFGKANLQKEDSVLVIAANSGIGSIAIQMAKNRGCRVIATAGSDEKSDYARQLGADHVINHYGDPEWYRQIRTLTENRGVDVIIEHPGQATFSNSLKALAIGGRIVTCGASSGPHIQLDLRHLFIKQQQILGSTMGSSSTFRKVMDDIRTGALQTPIYKLYTMNDIHEAYSTLINSKQRGKILLEYP